MPLIIAFIIGLVIAIIWDLAKNGGGLTAAILTPRGCCAVIAIGFGVVAVGMLIFGAVAAYSGW